MNTIEIKGAEHSTESSWWTEAAELTICCGASDSEPTERK